MIMEERLKYREIFLSNFSAIDLIKKLKEHEDVEDFS